MAETRAKKPIRPVRAKSRKATVKAPHKTTVAKRGAKSGAVARTRKKAAARRPDLAGVVKGALEDLKAVNVRVLDVRGLTDIADTMVIASGNSDRHVRSIAERVVEKAKAAGFRPMGIEGERDGEWVLVDLQDVIVHIMLPRIREFYRLESLWDVSAARREIAAREVEARAANE